MKDVEDVCSLFQFALSTRAGTDCVVHAVRALTEPGLECDVMLAKLHDEPRLHGLLPFVRALCFEQSCCRWRESVVQHPIRQGEGGEQGDLLMPLLFSLSALQPRHAAR